MNIKEKFITFFWVILVFCLFSVNYLTEGYTTYANDVYEVYLDGKIIGYISNENELYALINHEQSEIKEKYKVENVYPPENFRIIKTSAYDVKISSAEDIYRKIENLSTFTVEGYIITLNQNDTKKYIYLLDDKIFDVAINEFVNAFLSTEEYENYINNTQKEIETTGKIIEKMYFDEVLTKKKGYISVDDKIFTKQIDLSQYLLFGENYTIKKHKVKPGDTIQSISNDNMLNVQEFLIANPKYTSEDSLLTIGDSVNITLINPVITFTYEVSEVSDTEIPFKETIVYDSSKSPSYNEITTPGVTGITRITTEYTVKNGETQAGAKIVSNEVVVEKVDQVRTKGKYYPGSGSYIDTNSTWQWPTNYPYYITSPYAYRWGKLHEGLDISGTGDGSPIYAALDGVVIFAGLEGLCGSGGGVCVVIDHQNGYYTMYAHMKQNSLAVKTGDIVSRGQIIGGMGATGFATGVHLHFSVFYGYPHAGGSYTINPMRLWSK